MSTPLAVIGGGGMGRCVLDLVDAINAGPDNGLGQLEVVGVVDDGDPDRDLLGARGVRVLGGIDALDSLPRDVAYVIGIGSPAAKRRIDSALLGSGRGSPVLVHPNVHRGFDVRLGPGSVICSHVSIENHVVIGRHVHVNQNSTVGHDTVLGDHGTVSPLAAVSGGVTAEESVFLGTGASVRQGVTLHSGAVVGMGAVVLDDVPSGTTVVGVPARPL